MCWEEAVYASCCEKDIGLFLIDNNYDYSDTIYTRRKENI